MALPWVIRKSPQYSLELLHDGIYLYEISSSKVLLTKITIMGSSYDLLFAIVDAIVNRSLQRNFSFNEDKYANHLRIMFGLLVPRLNIEKALSYHRKLLCDKAANTMKLEVIEFKAIKTLLDSDEKIKSLQEKKDFLLISELTELDSKIAETLEQYLSEDSDSDAINSEEDDQTFVIRRFDYQAPTEPQVLQDMLTLNEFLQHRDPSRESLEFTEDRKIKIGQRALSTDFVLAGFRGVNHMPLRFSDETRRLYRTYGFQELRTKIPYYSESVLMSKFDFYRDINGIKEYLFTNEECQNRRELDSNADELERILLNLRNGNYILVTGLSNGAATDVRLFDNLLYFLQHLYSNGIIKFQRLLSSNLLQNEPLLKGLNAYNFFVSESETPNHALRYSFGQKNLYSPAALHPHYNQAGRPSFPYIGEIFISIRDASFFTSGRERHQLRFLEKIYEVNPTSYIGPEMELTGFSWLPKGQVIFSKVIKCPSFAGSWQEGHREKYGLTKEIFNQFKRDFNRFTDKQHRIAIEKDIIDHLIEHYSQELFRRAYEYARSKNKVLLFLNANGLLDIELPKRDMKKDADAKLKKIRNDIEQRLKEVVCNTQYLISEEKLTTKTLRIYLVPPNIVEDVMAKLKVDKSFFLEKERLRIPPSITGSCGTPLHSIARSYESYGELKSKLQSESYSAVAVNAQSDSIEATVLEHATKESLLIAQAQGKIGPREIVGWKLQDVDDKGNCFYDAAVDQMQRQAEAVPVFKEFLSKVPDTTLARDSLRLSIQGREFKDGDWADLQEIKKLSEMFNTVIAIVDTRGPLYNFVYHYIINGNYNHTTDITPLTNYPIIKFAFTGNHYMSVISHPDLVGALDSQPMDGISTATSIGQTHDDQIPQDPATSSTDEIEKALKFLNLGKEAPNMKPQSSKKNGGPKF